MARPGPEDPAANRPGNAGFSVDAIVLAGGRGSRLGGADKPALPVGERSLIASVLSAVSAAGARRVVVVGPGRPGLALAAGELRAVREDPPGEGPVAALRRGLAEVSAPWLLLLAADLPFLRAEHLGSLLAAAGAAGASGAVLRDDAGRPQWLAGCWQAGRLREGIYRYPGSSLHGLLGPLRPVLLPPRPGQPGPPPWLDCDTPEDMRLARAWANVPAGEGEGEVP